MTAPTGFTPAPPAQRASTRLRELLARPGGIVVAPGVFDGLSARLALAAGFECLYATGAGMTASRLGLPDLAVATMDDFVAQGGMMASLAPEVPLICDADTGFGGPINIARTVTRYERAGIAALHLEDQVLTKRCGHLTGKELVSLEDFLVRIRAAVLARASLPGCDLVLIARTDSIQSLGLQEGIARLKAAVQIGADVAFIEGVESADQVREVVAALAPTPVLLNLVRNSVTPNFSVQEAQALGVKIVIFPGAALSPVVKAMLAAFTALKRDGTEISNTPVDAQSSNGTSKMSPKDLFRLLGLDEMMSIDNAAGGTAFKDRV